MEPSPSQTPWAVATFYAFVSLDDPVGLKGPILQFCKRSGVKGTIQLAEEGINATIAAQDRATVEAVLLYLRQDQRFSRLSARWSSASEQPFQRMKVNLKREIVTMGVPEVKPSEQVGTYVEPQDWNQVISDPEVTVVDTRNWFEVGIGTFDQAVDPKTSTFREFPDYVAENLDPGSNKKVAMFCTGGIRCEKASSFMLAQGFDEVYHLQGGILNYLENVEKEDSLWEGECFVFDDRVAVGPGLEPGSYDTCRGCGCPLSDEQKRSVRYEAGVSCDHCFSDLTEDKRTRMQQKKAQGH